MADSSTRIIGSATVPRDHVEFVDVKGQRVAYVELKPSYKIISGDPMDSRICTAKINIGELLDFIKLKSYTEFMYSWVPTGKPN